MEAIVTRCSCGSDFTLANKLLKETEVGNKKCQNTVGAHQADVTVLEKVHDYTPRAKRGLPGF